MRMHSGNAFERLLLEESLNLSFIPRKTRNITIYSFIYLSFTLLNIVLCFSYHHQNLRTQAKFFKSIQKILIMAVDTYRLKITFDH